MRNTLLLLLLLLLVVLMLVSGCAHQAEDACKEQEPAP